MIDPASGSPQGVVEYLAEVARVVNQLREQQSQQGDQLSTLAGRVVGVETDQHALSESVASAVGDLISQARTEFQAQSASLATLREQAQIEVLALNKTVDVTRQTLDGLQAAWQGEFSTLTDAPGVHIHRTEDF
eukprot:15459858-Alexandrium_andersonii.AAC.1